MRWWLAPGLAVVAVSLACGGGAPKGRDGAPTTSVPTAAASAGTYAGIFQKFAAYDTVVEPDKNAPEWWAGAPSVGIGAVPPNHTLPHGQP